MGIIGYTYQQERTFDTLEGAAKNTGSDASSIMGAGLGMAMGVGLGGNFNILAKTLSPQEENQTTKSCIKCHSQLQDGAKFCQDCGQKQDLSCPKCQCKVELRMKFCSECGQKLGE